MAEIRVSYIDVENGKSYFCDVEVPPVVQQQGDEGPAPTDRVSGIFKLTDGDIALDLYRFDEFFHIPDEHHLVVRTQDAWFASLFDVVPAGDGRKSGRHTSVNSEHIIVNTAVVGWDAWKEEDRIRRTTFRVPGVEHLMRHRATYEAIVNTPFGEAPNDDIFSVGVVGGRIRAYYNYSGDMDRDHPTTAWPVIEFEFDSPLEIEEMRTAVLSFTRFLIAAASRSLDVSEQTISRLTFAEWEAQLKEKLKPKDYSIYYYKTAVELRQEKKSERLHGAFALLMDDDERAAFNECLRVWFARDADWRGATAAMANAFRLQDVMSPDRLLNATKWIEATPGAAAIATMTDEHSAALKAAIAKEAEALGYPDLAGRLKGAIGMVSKEMNLQRFTRLVTDLKAFYGPGIVGDDLAAWVTKAFSIRGNAAHRPIVAQSEAQYQEFSWATHAAECFAYLMLLRHLPMSEEGRKRVASARFVEYYRVEIKGRLPA